MPIHIVLYYMRNAADDRLCTSGCLKDLPIEDRLTDEDVYWGTRLGAAEMIKLVLLPSLICICIWMRQQRNTRHGIEGQSVGKPESIQKMGAGGDVLMTAGDTSMSGTQRGWKDRGLYRSPFNIPL